MFLAYSDRYVPQKKNAVVAAALEAVSADTLRGYVESLAYPRHYVAEREANIRAREQLLTLLRTFGYAPHLQGACENIVALPPGGDKRPLLLLGAHYDSVPGSPGADDNASAVAVCLECARLLGARNDVSTMLVFFNREEDGLLGSQEFVTSLTASSGWSVAEAHIFEMVGYCSSEPRSQHLPPGLPVKVRDVGDFLALLANRHSNALADALLTLAATYLAPFPVAALKIYLGLEKRFAPLLRSDHAPFWQADRSALLWTDTSEFRNPHYHQASDTPETLDYAFLAQVTKLALARAMTREQKEVR